MTENQDNKGSIAVDNAVETETANETVTESATELDEKQKQLLGAFDEMLKRHSTEMYNAENQKHVFAASERFTREILKKGVGVISLGLILITFGIIMICCLFSQSPDYLIPLKLSPIAAILFGIEILVTLLITHGRLKINIISVIVSAVLVVGCCTMGVILNHSYNEEKIEYNNRTIAAEIYDRSYKELRYITDIESMEVEVDLNPDGTGVTKGIEALSAADKVVVNVEFGGAYSAPSAFAADCKKIIEGFRIMDINITDFHFTNQSTFHSYKLDVEGRYLQDYSETRLTELVDHIYIEDANYLDDIGDLVNSDNSENSAD